MTHQTLTHSPGIDIQSTLPLLRLLNPKQHTWPVLVLLTLGLVVAYTTVALGIFPVWMATALVLVILLPAGILKWRDDRTRYGATIMILSILVAAQGLHTVEHLVQWLQYNVLYFTMRQSTGLLSPANAEWVHFTWNWLVLIVVVILMARGMRGWWMWGLLAVAAFHTIEHSYTFIRYQLILSELSAMDVANVTAQGLPGIVGRDGWLARSEWTRGTWICGIPGLTTAVRLDVHFWWNALEIGLLLLAGHFYLRAQARAGRFG